MRGWRGCSSRTCDRVLEGGGLPLATIYRGVVPFVLIDFAALPVISYVPPRRFAARLHRCGSTSRLAQAPARCAAGLCVVDNRAIRP
jgi:hypothetical protein